MGIFSNKAIQAHNNLTTGIHGVTTFILETSRTQTFINKTAGAGGLTFLNEGAGADPILASNNAAQILSLTGALYLSSDILPSGQLMTKSNTSFLGIFDHTNTINRTYIFPDVPGTVSMWTGSNAAVTRHWSAGISHLLLLREYSSGLFDWASDSPNKWAELAATNGTYTIPVNLPHGAIVTALRFTSQESTSAMQVTLYRILGSSGVPTTMANVSSTATMEEISDTSIDNATIDNDAYSYEIVINVSSNTGEARVRFVQIDYTVTDPQP